MIAGVAGGLAEHFGYDPTLVRLAIGTIGVFTFGTAFVAYLIAWAVIPQDDGRLIADEIRSIAVSRRLLSRPARGLWVGIALLVAGLFALGDASNHWPSRLLGPIALMTIGTAVLLAHRNSRGSSGYEFSGPTSAAPEDGDPAADAVPPTSNFEPADPDTESAFPTGTWPTAPHRTDTFTPHRHRSRPPRLHRERSSLTPITLSAIALVVGGAWMAQLSGAATVNPAFIAGAALAITGIGLVVGAWIGRGRGLVIVAIVLTVVCGIGSSLNVPWRAGVGERRIRPTSPQSIAPRYELAVGQLVIDLSSVNGTTPIIVHARVGIGQLEITVPADANVNVNARVDMGNIEEFASTNDGGWHQRRSFTSPGPGRTINVDARAGIGAIRLLRAQATVPAFVGSQGVAR